MGHFCPSLAIGKCCTFLWFLKGMVGSSKVNKKGTDHTGKKNGHELKHKNLQAMNCLMGPEVEKP